MRRPEPRRVDNIRFIGEDLVDAFPLSIYGAGVSRWVGDVEAGQKLVSGFALEQVTFGNATFVQNSREYLVKTGEVFLFQIGGHNTYRTGPAGEVHKRFAGFCGPSLLPLLRSFGLFGQDVIRPGNPDAVAAALKKAYGLLDKKDPGWLEKLSVTAFEILVLLKTPSRSAYPASLDAALTYIERNLGEDVVLPQICAQANLSATHLSKLFGQYVGVPPMRYLALQRMAQAKRLLAYSSMSIKQIAAMVGYDDQLHFSSQFKKFEGVAPRAFREGFPHV